MQDHIAALNVKVTQGAGRTFGVISGKVTRALKSLLALNVEWLYRLRSDPRRVWRQRGLLTFAGGILRRKVQSPTG